MTSLYCILARNANTAVIFRRGPSKHICLIGWDMNTHKFEIGQWFKGQIYVRKSDLSPNGKKLVYFAAKHGSKLPTWIAVSNSPFLTALVLWPTIGTWNDLSVFENDGVLELATYRSDSDLTPANGFAIPRQLQIKRKPWPGYFYKLPDHERLIRDGWIVHSGDPIYGKKSSDPSNSVFYRKVLLKGAKSAWLQLSATKSGKISYAILDNFETSIDLKADWADASGKEIFYSQGGKLLRIRFSKKNGQIVYDPPIELADFTDMTFEAIESPARARKW